MKPFDLQAAKRGEPIVTRDGRNVTFVGHAPKASEPYRVIVHIEGQACPIAFHEDGTLWTTQTRDDLFMAPRKRRVYVNLRPDGTADWHNSQETARLEKFPLVAIAVPVEIEE